MHVLPLVQRGSQGPLRQLRRRARRAPQASQREAGSIPGVDRARLQARGLRRREVSLSSKLRGTWLLRSRIDVTKDGKRHPDPMLGEDPVALLIYDDTGHFSAQFMKRDRSTVAQAATLPNAKNNTQAQGGYDAYFGTYTVDDSKGTVTQELLGSLSPGNVG